MMRNAFCMAKASLKLLLRSKGFLVVGVLIPMLATCMINILYGDPGEAAGTDEICELEEIDAQMAYLVNFNCLPVKVYDRAFSGESETLCASLAQAGLFQIFRADCRGRSTDEIMESARESALNDRVGAVIILEENPVDLQLFRVGEDARFELLEKALALCMERPAPEAKSAARVTYVAVNAGDDVNFARMRTFSYCIAIATIAFIFGGVLILGTILAEKQDHVFSRILLTTATKSSYILSKVLLIVGLSLLQTLVMVATFVCVVRCDLGFGVWEFAYILFLQGVVFNFLSVCAGLFCNSVAGAAFLAFVMWSVSALMAGTYFDISGASDLYKKVALLMPQRWALLAGTRFLNGSPGGYLLILGATAAYLIVILLIGILGLKLNGEE